MKANSTHVGKCESKGYVLFWWPLTGSSKSKHYTPIVRIAYGSMMISMVHPFPNQPNQIGYIQVLSPENFMISPWNHYIHWINSLRLKLLVWKPTKTIKSHHKFLGPKSISTWGPNLSQRRGMAWKNSVSVTLTSLSSNAPVMTPGSAGCGCPGNHPGGRHGDVSQWTAGEGVNGENFRWTKRGFMIKWKPNVNTAVVGFFSQTWHTDIEI